MLNPDAPQPQPVEDADTLLLKTRARLLAFLEHAPEAIFIEDADGRYVAVSNSFLALAGRRHEDVIGRRDEDLFEPQTAARFRAEDDKVRSSGEPRLFEETFDYDGQRLSFLTRKFPLPFGEVAGIGTNITARKATEAAHDRLAERLRVAMEGTGLGFYENNFTTGESLWSESAFRALGLEPSPDLKGSFELWRSRVHPDDVERVLASHAEAAARNDAWSVQYRIIHPKTGEVRWVLAHTQFSDRPDGKYSTGVAIDITEQKRLEEQQGLLVSELNHRVKNMLAVVQSIAAQTFKDDGDPAEQRKAFENRLVALAGVHDLLQRDSWQPVSIRRVVERAIMPFERDDGSPIAYDGPDLLLDTSRCVSMALALRELCTNAVKHGALSVRCGRAEIRWKVEGGQFSFDWRETGGPAVAEPAERGFGTRMLERALSREMGTTIRLEFAPEGLRCRFTAPVNA